MTNSRDNRHHGSDGGQVQSIDGGQGPSGDIHGNNPTAIQKYGYWYHYVTKCCGNRKGRDPERDPLIESEPEPQDRIKRYGHLLMEYYKKRGQYLYQMSLEHLYELYKLNNEIVKEDLPWAPPKHVIGLEDTILDQMITEIDNNQHVSLLKRYKEFPDCIPLEQLYQLRNMHYSVMKARPGFPEIPGLEEMIKYQRMPKQIDVNDQTIEALNAAQMEYLI